MSTKLYSGLRSAITDPFAIATPIRECLETVAASDLLFLDGGQ